MFSQFFRLYKPTIATETAPAVIGEIYNDSTDQDAKHKPAITDRHGLGSSLPHPAILHEE